MKLLNQERIGLVGEIIVVLLVASWSLPVALALVYGMLQYAQLKIYYKGGING